MGTIPLAYSSRACERTPRLALEGWRPPGARLSHRAASQVAPPRPRSQRRHPRLAAAAPRRHHGAFQTAPRLPRSAGGERCPGPARPRPPTAPLSPAGPTCSAPLALQRAGAGARELPPRWLPASRRRRPLANGPRTRRVGGSPTAVPNGRRARGGLLPPSLPPSAGGARPRLPPRAGEPARLGAAPSAPARTGTLPEAAGPRRAQGRGDGAADPPRAWACPVQPSRAGKQPQRSRFILGHPPAEPASPRGELPVTWKKLKIQRKGGHSQAEREA